MQFKYVSYQRGSSQVARYDSINTSRSEFLKVSHNELTLIKEALWQSQY